jgi:hypothetical protein
MPQDSMHTVSQPVVAISQHLIEPTLEGAVPAVPASSLLNTIDYEYVGVSEHF